jgi:hypothetical protein
MACRESTTYIVSVVILFRCAVVFAFVVVVVLLVVARFSISVSTCAFLSIPVPLMHVRLSCVSIHAQSIEGLGLADICSRSEDGGGGDGVQVEGVGGTADRMP